MKISAIIVAAGRSQRFLDRAKELNLSADHKLFVKWEKKPLYVHTLLRLTQVVHFEQIIIVAATQDLEGFREGLAAYPQFQNLQYCEGGRRRQDSVRMGLEQMEQCDRILIHDAARPFLSAEFLNQLFTKSQSNAALIPVVPITETIKEIDAHGQVRKTHPRSALVRVQTPQIFDFDLLKKAHEQLSASDEEFTDDAMLIEEMGYPVQTCFGSEDNIKVTYPEDLIHRGLLS